MGVLGLQRLFPGVPIKGRVIVCADNGTKTYPLFPQFLNGEHFSHAHKVAPVKIKDPKVKLCELPVEIKDRDIIHKVCSAKTGFNENVLTGLVGPPGTEAQQLYPYSRQVYRKVCEFCVLASEQIVCSGGFVPRR